MSEPKILVLRHDDVDLDEDVTEYNTYRGKPFTGIIEEYSKDLLGFKAGYFAGLRSGYSVAWDDDGNLTEIYECYRNKLVGIFALWDKKGEITALEKRWSSELIEKLEIQDGVYHIEQIMDARQQKEWLEHDKYVFERNAPQHKWKNHYRPEPVSYLFEEAMTRYREGTLFNQSFLYTDPKEWET